MSILVRLINLFIFAFVNEHIAFLNNVILILLQFSKVQSEYILF